MVLLLRVVFSIASLLLLYAGMVIAFHLLNLPSNFAVLLGVCLLLLLTAAGLVLYRVIWKRR